MTKVCVCVCVRVTDCRAESSGFSHSGPAEQHQRGHLGSPQTPGRWEEVVPAEQRMDMAVRESNVSPAFTTCARRRRAQRQRGQPGQPGQRSVVRKPAELWKHARPDHARAQPAPSKHARRQHARPQRPGPARASRRSEGALTWFPGINQPSAIQGNWRAHTQSCKTTA